MSALQPRSSASRTTSFGGRARHGVNNLDHRGGRVIDRPLYQRSPRARGPGVLLLHGAVCVLLWGSSLPTRVCMVTAVERVLLHMSNCARHRHRGVGHGRAIRHLDAVAAMRRHRPCRCHPHGHCALATTRPSARPRNGTSRLTLRARVLDDARVSQATDRTVLESLWSTGHDQHWTERAHRRARFAATTICSSKGAFTVGQARSWLLACLLIPGIKNGLQFL